MFFPYLDSDLSDNAIEALNAEVLTSLNFLKKLLVMVNIHEHISTSYHYVHMPLAKDLA